MLREHLRDFFRSIWRSVGTRQKTLELLKTMTLVVPLTVLIWIYAERAQTSTEKATIFFNVTTGAPDQWASLVDDRAPVTVELSGSRSKVDALKSELERISSERRLYVALNAAYASGTSPEVTVADLLNNYPSVRASGVTVTSASPPTVRIRLEELKSPEIRVVVPEKLRGKLQNVVIDPPVVRVRGPQSVVDGIDSISLDLATLEPKVTPGPQKLTNVPLTLPQNEVRLTVSPATIASVRFDVAGNEAEYVIPSLPIVVQLPLPLNGKVTVTPREKTVTNVKVRGPSDQIDKLRAVGTAAPQIVPTAVLAIKPEDVNALSAQQREVEVISLPPGVQVIGEKKTIEFTVKDNASPE